MSKLPVRAKSASSRAFAKDQPSMCLHQFSTKAQHYSLRDGFVRSNRLRIAELSEDQLLQRPRETLPQNVYILFKGKERQRLNTVRIE